MPDEIYDYFGGSSPRKMEPLDESEMFEDLLPSRKPEPVQEPSVEVLVEDDERVVAESTVADAWNSPSHENLHNDTGDLPAPVKSHWDDLASSLGLSPPSSTLPPAVEPQKTSKPIVPEPKRDHADKRKVRAETESRRAPKSSDVSGRKADKFVNPPKAPQQPLESAADSISELFLSAEEIDYETTSAGIDAQPDDDFENDPFAAFSGSQTSRRNEPETVFEELEPEILESSEPVDKDFIEFEVQDIGGQRRDERETRSRRGRNPDRTEKTGGSEQVRKPTGHDKKEVVGESRETIGGRRHQRTESKNREPDRNEARRDRHNSGNRPDGNRAEGNRAQSNRSEGSRTERSRTEGSRSEGSRTEGSRSEGSRTEGSRTEGSRTEGSRTEGSRTEGSRTEGSRTEGSRTEGSRTEGSRTEGSRTEGSRTEGSRNEGSRTEGSRTESKRAESNSGRRVGRDTSKRDNLAADPASRNRNSVDRSKVNSEKNQEDSDDETENDFGIKKAKIPTWDEAIGGVVEQNIKRHQSNTKNGGKRRRN